MCLSDSFSHVLVLSFRKKTQMVLKINFNDTEINVKVCIFSNTEKLKIDKSNDCGYSTNISEIIDK